MSDNTDAIKLVAVLVFFLFLPLLAPELFLIISALVWPVIYIVMWVKSLGFNLSESLPWWYSDNFAWGAIFYYAVLLFLIGLTRGLIGSLAMLVTWLPLAIIPGYLLALGVAVNQPWYDYKNEHYTPLPCTVIDGRHVCEFVPKSDLQLPSFIEDYNTDDIIKVTPYLKN